MRSVADHRQGTGAFRRIAEGLGDLPVMLPDFVAAPPASDRAFWTGLPKDMARAILVDAETALDRPWPTLTATAYRAFTLTGDRAGYEADYFERRRRLNALALAEAIKAEGRFTDAMIDGLVLVCEESGWQLPAHNSQERDGRHDPLPDPDRPVIDLFAAETAAQLAMVAALHAETLAKACPMVLARIDREIERRIARPYLDRHFWWMGNGVDRMINWTPWCTQNVLLSTFCRPTDQGTRRAAVAKAVASLDDFFDSYGEDGACDEGPQYYRHAALCLFGALSVLDAVAPGAFAPLWRLPKLRNMAAYIRNVHVDGRTYINFADASAVLDPCGAREYLFGRKVGSADLSSFAAMDARTDPRPDLPDEINLWYRLLALATSDEMAAVSDRAGPVPDLWFESVGLFVVRDDRFVVAAKAGANDDGHNHNDVGSVTVYKNGRPLLIDIGVETYTKKTFSPERYDIWTMQSGFHNLPSFDGIGQSAGAEFAARDVAVDLAAEAPWIDMDIAGAYPPAAGVRRYRRTVRLLKSAHVEIADSHDGTGAAVLSLMVAEAPVVSDGHIRLGDLAEIAVTGAGDIGVETIGIKDPRLRQAWPDTLYRILVPMAGSELNLTIS